MIYLMFIISLLPPLLLFFFMRNRIEKDNKAHRTLCSKALLSGILSVFLVLLFSGCTALIIGLTGIKASHPLLQTVLYNFIVLAGAEEAAKFLTLKRFMKKHPYPYSWMTIVICMMIIGIGFGLVEAVIYAIGADAMTMIVRGITMGHAGYGFIMGWFYGKAKKTGKSSYTWIALIFPILLHGTYDCFLSDYMKELNDNLPIISLVLAIMSIVTIIIAIRFLRKQRSNEVYMAPFSEFSPVAEEAPAAKQTENL